MHRGGSASSNVLWLSRDCPEDKPFSKRAPPLSLFIHHLVGADKGLLRDVQVPEVWGNGSPGHSDPTSACNRYRLNVKHLIILLRSGNITETRQCIINFQTEADLPWPLTKMLEPVASRRNGTVNHF